MGQRRSRNTLREMKMETQHSKIYVTHKSSSKREVYSETGLPQETRKTQIINLNLQLKELEKEE